MKIISIVPGFGGTFYCGNCLRDSAYATSLRNTGHDALILPMYLPLTIQGTPASRDIPVFYGAVNIYLKQQFPFLQNMPDWMEKMLNSRSVLRFAASKAGSTRAGGLEELTESMLLGEKGRQSHELEEVVRFIRSEKPDVVHFSNALLLGMAHRIKKETGAKVVCSLQDEDVWVDVMHENYREKIWKLLAEKAKDVDVFVTVSRYFAGFMKDRIHIPEEKLKVVPIGIDLTRYETSVIPEYPALGYVSRICHENGFHVLVDAFILLKKDPLFKSLKLYATGGMTGDDKPYIREQLRKLGKHGLRNDLRIFPDFTPEGLKAFLKQVSVVSVPVLHGEAFGLYQLESMASGVPVVQPALGAFPEIVEKSGGGVIYHPNTPEALAGALAALLNDTGKLNALKIRGREGVEKEFNCISLVNKMLEIYQDH